MILSGWLEQILDEIGGALERGNRVELRGFGAFSVRKRKASLGDILGAALAKKETTDEK